jgi:hypothetical protein
MKGYSDEYIWPALIHNYWSLVHSRKQIVQMIALLDMCDELGVETSPAEVAEGVFIIPLFSWYNSSFDEADPRPGGAA